MQLVQRLIDGRRQPVDAVFETAIRRGEDLGIAALALHLPCQPVQHQGIQQDGDQHHGYNQDQLSFHAGSCWLPAWGSTVERY